VNGNYTYYVSASISNLIESAPSEKKAVKITDIYPPAVPVNLVVFKATDHLFLNWKEVSDKDLSHYRIYRRLPTETQFILIKDNYTGLQFKDMELQKEKRYYYVVTAVDDKGNESDYSNVASERF